MTDERIRRAKRAELQALVDRHGTENERWALTMSGMMRAGVTLTQLRTAALNDESLGPLPPDPDFLARIARRVDRRRRLGLPRKDCTARRPAESCRCLGETLDEIGESADKREVLAAAHKLHRTLNPPFSGAPSIGALPARARRDDCSRQISPVIRTVPKRHLM